MPQIREYTAENTALRPTETGVEAYAQAGRRIGAFYNQAGESEKQAAQDEARAAGAVATAKEGVARSVSGIAKSVDVAMKQADDQITHQEISHGMATFAQLHSDLTDSWNNTAKSADPNDTSIAGKFRETQLEPALDQFTSSFHTTQGQQWASAHTAALRDHMFEKQSADMSALAGDAVAVNVRKTTNAWTNTARNDPSSVDFLLKTADASIGGIVGSSPNLKGAEAARVHSQVTQKAKEDIVKAGALGAIEKSADPEKAAKTFADRYPEYVNGQEIDQLAKAANMYRRLNDSENRASQAEAKRQTTGKFHADANKWELSTIDENGNAVMPPDGVKQLKDMVGKYGGDADPGRVTAMVHRVQELGKVLDPASAANLKKTSDRTERGLYTQMVLPGAEPMSEDKINGAYSKGDLSYAARNRLLKDFADDKTPDGQTLAKSRGDFFRNFAPTIDPGRDQATGAGASALGSQKIGEAQREARRLEGVLRSQDKDPHSLYDPNSPDFFGKQVNRFRPTLQEKAAFDAQVKADQAGRPSSNLGTITGIDVKEIPAGTSPTDAMKLFKSGTQVRLPDGRIGTVP